MEITKSFSKSLASQSVGRIALFALKNYILSFALVASRVAIMDKDSLPATDASHSRLTLHFASHLIQHDGAGQFQVPLESLQQTVAVLPCGQAHAEQLFDFEVAHGLVHIPMTVAQRRMRLFIGHTQHTAPHLCHKFTW